MNEKQIQECVGLAFEIYKFKPYGSKAIDEERLMFGLCKKWAVQIFEGREDIIEQEEDNPVILLQERVEKLEEEIPKLKTEINRIAFGSSSDD